MFKKTDKRTFYLRNVNFRIIIYSLILSIIGIFIVQSATKNEVSASVFSTVQKQIIGVVIGNIIMVILMLIDYHTLIKYSYLIYAVSILLLVYVKYINPLNISNANRWMYIPGFGTIQPSEFAKVAVVIMAAFILRKISRHINNILFLMIYFAITGISVYLINVEPDLSTSVIILIGLIVMVFICGINRKWITAVVSITAVLAVTLLFLVYQPEQKYLNQLVDRGVIKSYQIGRINSYFFPEQNLDKSRQQLNSVMAIGGGQLYGKGLNTSTYESVKNGNFLSEEQCDFIFAVVGEELGFIGSCVIIFLYLCLFFEGLRIASKCQDIEGKMVVCGYVSILAFQCFVNIGVAILVLPNTGTPLPFISAGLSSLLSTYMMIGIILNIGLHRKVNYPLPKGSGLLLNGSPDLV